MAKKSITTPRGVAVWPRLNKPDTKFDADGVYQLALKLEGKDAAAFKKLVDERVAESFKTAKEDNKKAAKTIKTRHPYEAETDDDGNETGATLFRFKMKAVGKNGKTGETWKNTVKLYDAKGKPTKVMVGGGSSVKVSFNPRPYYMASNKEAGITMDLLAVQIIELVQGGTAESYGFEEEDGGFEDDGSYAVPEEAEAKPAEAEDADDDTEAEDGDGSLDF